MVVNRPLHEPCLTSLWQAHDCDSSCLSRGPAGRPGKRICSRTSLGQSETVENLDLLRGRRADTSVLEVLDSLAALINLGHRLDSELKMDLGPLPGDPYV